MQFPAYFLMPDGSVKAFHYPTEVQYTTDDGEVYNYPAQIWSSWTDANWARIFPGWKRLAYVDERPSFDPATHILFRQEQGEWMVNRNELTLTVTYAVTPKSPDLIASELEGGRNIKVRAIDTERDRRLALGALHGGKRFSTSNESRTDLGGMATTAGLVLSGALIEWPEDYAKGWIAIDNSRFVLPTPADGIALAASVTLSYSATVQYARDLKDAALAAADPSTVDELAGWPD